MINKKIKKNKLWVFKWKLKNKVSLQVTNSKLKNKNFNLNVSGTKRDVAPKQRSVWFSSVADHNHAMLLLLLSVPGHP